MTVNTSFDPVDWAAFRAEAQKMLDFCIDYLRQSHDRPVWQEMPAAVRAGFDNNPVPVTGMALTDLAAEARDRLAPYITGNTSPRFFGWVHGGGTANGLMADMLSSALNANCGGRDHIATLVEREVLSWCKQIFGFPATASGILTPGTSSATLIALASARQSMFGMKARRQGVAHIGQPLIYASAEVHSAIVKAAEILGHGTESVRLIPVDADFRIQLPALEAAITADLAAGLLPCCLVGCAGTVNTGASDDLPALAALAQRYGLWLHVDGAFGAWARLADAPWAAQVAGLELADSLAFDFHKWPSVPYEAGCVLIRDEAAHRGAFASRPDYLGAGGQALSGGDPWFCEYGIDLSRGFRALKVWMALREFGTARIGASISANCAQASQMQRLVQEKGWRLMAPTVLNICCFRIELPNATAATVDRYNTDLVARLQRSGEVVFSTTKIRGQVAIRAAIVNHRTTAADIDRAIKAVDHHHCLSLLGH